MPKVNFAGIPTSFEALPEGTYEAVFTGFKARKAKTDQSDMYNLEFTIDEEGFKGRKLFRNFSLKPEALWSLKRTLLLMGVDEEALESGELDLDEIFDELKGTEVTLDVTQREHEDKVYNDLEIISDSL